MKSPAAWLLSRPRGMLALCLCLAALGLVAAWGVPLRLWSAGPAPALTVTTEVPDTGPQEVEDKVTRPLEEELRAVTSCRGVFSLSQAGSSQVTLQLDPRASVSAAAQDLRGRLRRLRPHLPSAARVPVVSQYDPAQRPVAVLAVSGGQSLATAGAWCRLHLIPALRRLPGLAQVELSGAPQPEILVQGDPARLKALGLSLTDLAEGIRTGSQGLPGGLLHQGGLSLPLRVEGRVHDRDGVAGLPVAARDSGRLVSVDQVAQVWQRDRPPERINRLGGRPVVALTLHQTSQADPVRLWGQVRQVLDRAAASPQGAHFKVEVVFSQAALLRTALGRLGNMALLAAGAAALVLLLFLRRPGPTLAALAALPVSLLWALLLLRLLDRDLDLVTLSGLALALGILVDNAVVVVEAVAHHWRSGRAGVRGVLAGVREVAAPVSFATLTTLAAFLPLVLLGGDMRRPLEGFFWGMGLCLAASLAAALVLTPLLLALLPGRAAPAGPGLAGRDLYGRLLDWGLARPWQVLALAGLLVLGGGLAALNLGYQQGEAVGEKGWRVLVVLPPGSATGVTDQVCAPLETAFSSLAGVERVHGAVWGDQGRITVTAQQGADLAQVEAALRERLPKDGPAAFHLLPLGSGPQETTLGVMLLGPDLASLEPHLKELVTSLRALPMVNEAVVHLGAPAPVLELPLDHAALGRLGLSVEEVARQVRLHLAGPVATRLSGEEEEIEVRVQGQDLANEGPASLRRLFIPTSQGDLIALDQITAPRVRRLPTQLTRHNLRRVINLTLRITSGDLWGAARAAQAVLDGHPAPPGFAWRLGAEVDRLRDQRRSMLLASLLALALVYLVMVAATESLKGPLLIMAAAPPAAAGAAAALWALGYPVDQPVYLGGILLCGLVVNVNIVMLDAMERLRRTGLDAARAARLGAGRRLRPVLMTTLSTLAASLPLLLDQGVGSSAWSPLALTLAAGLAASALVCLLLTPVLYKLVYASPRR